MIKNLSRCCSSRLCLTSKVGTNVFDNQFRNANLLKRKAKLGKSRGMLYIIIPTSLSRCESYLVKECGLKEAVVLDIAWRANENDGIVEFRRCTCFSLWKTRILQLARIKPTTSLNTRARCEINMSQLFMRIYARSENISKNVQVDCCFLLFEIERRCKNSQPFLCPQVRKNCDGAEFVAFFLSTGS